MVIAFFMDSHSLAFLCNFEVYHGDSFLAFCTLTLYFTKLFMVTIQFTTFSAYRDK